MLKVSYAFCRIDDFTEYSQGLWLLHWRLGLSHGRKVEIVARASCTVVCRSWDVGTALHAHCRNRCGTSMSLSFLVDVVWASTPEEAKTRFPAVPEDEQAK